MKNGTKNTTHTLLTLLFFGIIWQNSTGPRTRFIDCARWWFAANLLQSLVRIITEGRGCFFEIVWDFKMWSSWTDFEKFGLRMQQRKELLPLTGFSVSLHRKHGHLMTHDHPQTHKVRMTQRFMCSQKSSDWKVKTMDLVYTNQWVPWQCLK